MGKSKGDLGPKILTIDIELKPNVAHVWGMWDQNVGLSQLLEAQEVICFAAKWYGKKKVMFYSVFHHGKEAMLEAAHSLLEEADIVVHYNGKRFDIPHLNREFVENGMEPPAPFAQIDLLHVVRRQFKFPSNKLDYVVQALNLGAKEQHTGHQLWKDCLDGKKSAWALMRSYNKQDVIITEALYEKLLPWVPSHPSVGLYTNEENSCPACGSTNLVKRGMAYTSVSSYQRLRCNDCGRWSRDGTRVNKVSVR